MHPEGGMEGVDCSKFRENENISKYRILKSRVSNRNNQIARFLSDFSVKTFYNIYFFATRQIIIMTMSEYTKWHREAKV